MQHQGRFAGAGRAVGDADRQPSIRGEARAARRQPIRVVGLDRKRHGLARQERSGHVLHALRIGDAPARRRLVERQVEAQIARRGDRGHAAGDLGDGAGQDIGAAMAAQERHGGRAVLGDCHHGRLGALFRDERAERAHQNPAGAQADDWRACGKERAQMIAGLAEALIRRDAMRGERVNPRTRKRRFEVASQAERRRAEDDDRGAAR